MRKINKISIKTKMIAPCGMNCSICTSQFREIRTCTGCNINSNNKPKYCSVCKIKTCPKRLTNSYKYCFECDAFPCARLKQLDKRYHTKYGMSMIENLRNIQQKGIRSFVRNEKKKWLCFECGKLLCVHKESCVICGSKRSINFIRKQSC